MIRSLVRLMGLGAAVTSRSRGAGDRRLPLHLESLDGRAVPSGLPTDVVAPGVAGLSADLDAPGGTIAPAGRHIGEEIPQGYGAVIAQAGRHDIGEEIPT